MGANELPRQLSVETSSISGMMGNRMPAYSKGVLDYVAQKGESRVTWQPQVGLRFATVAVKYDN